MSDFNPLDRAKIPTHRSSFDLSSKKLFTAKIGEILPCYWQIAIPDTKYRISFEGLPVINEIGVVAIAAPKAASPISFHDTFLKAFVSLILS